MVALILLLAPSVMTVAFSILVARLCQRIAGRNAWEKKTLSLAYVVLAHALGLVFLLLGRSDLSAELLKGLTQIYAAPYEDLLDRASYAPALALLAGMMTLGNLLSLFMMVLLSPVARIPERD